MAKSKKSEEVVVESTEQKIEEVQAPKLVKKKGRASLYGEPLLRVLAFVPVKIREAMDNDGRPYSTIIRQLLEEHYKS